MNIAFLGTGRWRTPFTVRCSALLTIGLVMFLVVPEWSRAAKEESPQEREKAMADLPESERNQMQLLSQVLEFRSVAGKDLAAAARQFDGRKPMELITKRHLNKMRPEAWRMFFSGSVVLLGNLASETPVVGCYNPFFDAVVLMNWKKDGKEFSLDSLAVRQGCDLDGTNIQPEGTPLLARWLAGKDAGPTGLVQQYKEFSGDFDGRFPSDSKKDVAIKPGDKQSLILDLVEAHMLLSHANLEATHGGAGTPIGNYVKAVKTLIAFGDAKALAPYLPTDNLMKASQMVALPKMLRKNLAPQYCLLSEETATMFLTSPSAPTYYGLFEFSFSKGKGKGGEARPTRFVFCDMGKR